MGLKALSITMPLHYTTVVLVDLVFPIAMARWLVGYGLKLELQILLLSKHS